MIIQGTQEVELSSLRGGEWAALFSDSTAMQRVLHVSAAARGGVRVEWDHGHGTRTRVRVMAGSNKVQVSL